jgi:hypothetical protein
VIIEEDLIVVAVVIDHDSGVWPNKLALERFRLLWTPISAGGQAVDYNCVISAADAKVEKAVACI